MSFKWKLVPGEFSNDYGVTVPANSEYVSSDFGDDIQGDGSASKPFASVTSTNAIVQGFFLDEFFGGNLYCYSDGFTKIVCSQNGNKPTRGLYGGEIVYSGGFNQWNFFFNVVFSDSENYLTNQYGSNNSLLIKEGETNPSGVSIKSLDRCTLVGDYHRVKDLVNSILASDKVDFENANIANCLISNSPAVNCKFAGESDYTPASGADDVAKLEDLRNRAAVAHGGSPEDYFVNCLYGDPQFQNPNIGDYSLKPGSIAASMSPEGSYIGCYKETIAFHPTSDANNSDWYHIDGEKTKNIAVGSEMQVVDSQIDGYVNSKPKSVGSVRELGRIIAKLENDVINGGYIKAVQHFDPSTSLNSNSNLTVGKAYFVASGSANINGTTYVENDRFTAQSSSFTGDAVLHPANDNMMRQAIIVRFSRGDDQFFAGAQLKPNTYYFVEGNSVTYAGGSKQPGSFFHTNSTVLNFTGQGYVREAFEVDYENAPTAGFIFDREKKLMLNYNGDSVLNEIESSNAKLDYDFGRELNIFARFIQVCLVYKAQGNIPYPNE